jgi:hypothetical protein
LEIDRRGGGIKKAPKLWQYNTKSFEEKTSGTIKKRAHILPSFFAISLRKEKWRCNNFLELLAEREREMLQAMARRSFEATS